MLTLHGLQDWILMVAPRMCGVPRRSRSLILQRSSAGYVKLRQELTSVRDGCCRSENIACSAGRFQNDHWFIYSYR